MEKKMRKVDVIIVGAEKAGTTSLKSYVNEHPEILGHQATEFTYFVNKKNEYELDFEEVFEKYFDGSQWTDQKLIAAKNASIHSDLTALERLNKHNPNCKLIYCVRNPVERAYSEYTYDRSHNRMNNSDFGEIVEILNSGEQRNRFYKNYIGHSLYHEHLDNMYQLFPKENVMVIFLEDLKTNPEDVMKRVFNFMKVDDSFKVNLDKVYNKTSVPKSKMMTRLIYFLRSNKKVNKFLRSVIPFKMYKTIGAIMVDSNRSNTKFESMSNETRSFLNDYFKPHNERLGKMIDSNLPFWN